MPSYCPKCKKNHTLQQVIPTWHFIQNKRTWKINFKISIFLLLSRIYLNSNTVATLRCMYVLYMWMLCFICFYCVLMNVFSFFDCDEMERERKRKNRSTIICLPSFISFCINKWDTKKKYRFYSYELTTDCNCDYIFLLVNVTSLASPVSLSLSLSLTSCVNKYS